MAMDTASATPFTVDASGTGTGRIISDAGDVYEGARTDGHEATAMRLLLGLTLLWQPPCMHCV